MKRNQNRICIANAKGGVGKSTTALEIAAHAGAKGLKTLVVDLDPQGNVSRILLGKRPAKEEKTLFHLLTEPDAIETKDVIRKASNNWPKTWILPCNQQLSKAYKHIETTPDWSDLVDEIIQPIEDNFDLILLDTAPSMATLTSMAMRAANKLLIPTDPSIYGNDGIEAVLGMRDFYEKKGHHIDLVRIFVTASLKLGANASRKMRSMLTEKYEELFLDVELPHCVKIFDGQLDDDLPRSGMSLLEEDHKLYQGYRLITDLVLEAKK